MKRARRGLAMLAIVVLGQVSATPGAPAAEEPATRRLGPFKTPPGVGPTGSPLAADFLLGFAVYHLPRPRRDPAAVLAKLLAGDPDLTLVKELPDVAPARPQVALQFPPIEKVALTEEDALNLGRGLSAGDQRAVAKSGVVSVLQFAGPGRLAQAVNRRAQKLVADLASACGGLIWDIVPRRLYSQGVWEELRGSWAVDGIPDVRLQISIDVYRHGELIRMISRGMSKFALPDVVVNRVASEHRAMGTVINLLCQRLIEGAVLESGGRFELAVDEVRHADARKVVQSQPEAEGRAKLRLRSAKPEEGDARNRLLEIAFPGPEAKLQEQHAALLGRLFGREEETVATDLNQELVAASARAREAVLKHKPRYRMQPPFGEQLMVKAPFEMDDGGTEWMWVEVVRWDGLLIDGVLQNDSQGVSGLKSGARVRVNETKLFDYILTRPDGSKEGNETGALLEKAR